jgi:hypothetical protein
MDARVTLFHAEDFEARLYQLESDVAGSFSMPALQGVGARTYLAVSALPVRSVTLQGRIAVTYLEDAVRQGAGPDLVEGNRLAEFSILLRWRLSPFAED